MTLYRRIKRKIDSWKRVAAAAAAGREAARLLRIGLDPSPGEWQRLPDYARPALEALKRERDQHKPYDRLRWFQGLLWGLRPTTEVVWEDYAECCVLRPGDFTAASLEAALRKFEVFPAPSALWKFLTDWGEEHRSRGRPDKDHRPSSLALTDEERLHLQAAVDAARAGQTPITSGLTKRQVSIAQVLALPCWQRKPPTHQQLADATGTKLRTVRRELPILRALGLLPSGPRHVASLRKPKRVWGSKAVTEAIARHFGRSASTVYRWERAASLEKPHEEE